MPTRSFRLLQLVQLEIIENKTVKNQLVIPNQRKIRFPSRIKKIINCKMLLAKQLSLKNLMFLGMM